MKVITLRTGYFGRLREPGDEFEVPDGAQGSWFQPVEQKISSKEPKAPKTSSSKETANDLI